jgi:predicted phosphodiesterase
MPESPAACCPGLSAAANSRESIAAMAAVKLAVTSDLHLPITKNEPLVQLAQEILAFGPDALVLAGDLGESLTDVQRCLALFKQHISVPIWVLAGNHDVWARPPYDSRRLWLEKVPEAVRQAGCQYLEGEAFVLHGVAVAGTIAWYDYSGADPSIQASALQYAQEKMNFNADALRIDWEWSDPEFAELVGTPFLALLDHLEADPAVRHIVVVTHMPLLEEQMHRMPGNRDWGFSNAYFGNLTLGEKVLRRPKVSHIISGHTHFGKQSQVTRPDGPPVDVRVVASDYERPAWMGLTFEAAV